MRIGVTGAFGFLGASLVSRLLEEQPVAGEVVAFAAHGRRNPLFDPARTTVIALDILDAATVRRATRGLDVLFHFAGRTGFARRDKRETWDVNVLGLRNVLEAALANRTGKVVHVSSINALGACLPAPCGAVPRLADEQNDVYAPAAGNLLSFRSPGEALAAVHSSACGDYRFLARVKVAYFDSKLAGHELARLYFREHGVPVVTALPGTAIGPGDVHNAISSLVDRVFAGRLPATFGGGTSFVDSRDVADGVLLAARRGRPGESYIISGRDEDNISYREFLRRVAGVAARMGRQVRQEFFVVPRWAGLPVAAVLESAAPGSWLALAMSTAFVRAGSMVHSFTSAKACRELGYRPRRQLEEGIADCWKFQRLLEAGGG